MRVDEPQQYDQSEELEDAETEVYPIQTETRDVRRSWVRRTLKRRKLADLLNRNDDVDRLTDAQAGVLLWASQMAHHRATVLEESAARIHALRFQALLEDTVSSVRAVSAHLAIPLSSKQIENSVTREMARHAKSGGPFSSQEHREKTLALQGEYGDEVAEGRRWFETEFGAMGLLGWPPSSLHLV